MSRTTNAVPRHKRRKKLLKRAKGFWGDRKNHVRQSKNAVMKAMHFNYEHRKQKKGDFRKLWIMRIGVAAKLHGLSYSKLMHGLKLAECSLNRKMLAELAVNSPSDFAAVAQKATVALGK
jgi:large subunit ribosomal protein L20